MNRRLFPAATLAGLLLAVAAAPADVAVFTGPAGNYTVTAPAPVRVTQPSPTSVLFDWGSMPPPPPIPTPGPTPAKGVLHVTAVFDTETMQRDHAAIRGSTTIGPELRSMNAIWRTYEAKSPELDRMNMRSTVQSVGVPCLIVQTADGHLVRAQKITTEDDLINTIKGLR